ncbi:MAG: putative Fe-S protein YdhL (DUF1289 family) [Oleispira sp.]
MDGKKKSIPSSKVENTVVKSPCVNICCLNEEDVCLGCYRSCDEICKWGAMNNEQRNDVMKKVAEREQDSGNMMKI